MGNLNTKNLIEFDYVVNFYSKLNLKPKNFNPSESDRYLTFNSILEILIDFDQKETILHLRNSIINNDNITTIFFKMLLEENSNLYSNYHEAIEFYFDSDLLKRFS